MSKLPVWPLLAVLGCAAVPPLPSSAPQMAGPVPTPAATSRVRYQPSLRDFSLEIAEGAGFLGWGVRAVREPSGKVHFAEPERADDASQVVRVPAHLGGGWIFSGNNLTYADDFLAPQRPTSLLWAGRDIEFGFDFVQVGMGSSAEFLSARTFEPIARPASLPAGTEHIAALDAHVALALLDDHTLRYSNDAGKTWSRTAYGDLSVDQLRTGSDALYFYASQRLFRLEPGGGLRLVPEDAPAVFRPWPDSPWDDAVRQGFSLNAAQVLLPGPDARVLELATGQARAFRVDSNRYGGCEVVSGVDGGLLICRQQLVSNGVGRPVFERQVDTNKVLATSLRGALLLPGPCLQLHPLADERERPAGQRVVCVRHAGGRWDSYVLPEPWADGSDWPLAFRSDDTLVGLVRLPTGLTFVDIPSGRSVPVQLPPDVDWSPPQDFDVLDDGRLCIWTQAARSVLIDERGQVDWREPAFEVVRWGQRGPRGFALSRAGKAFETVSCGAAWSAVAPPPGPWARAATPPCDVPDKLASPSYHQRSDCSFECNEVGCHIAPFLRFGWEL